MSENPIIEQYRQTLEALHKLREKYIKQGNLKMVRVLDEEIDEVARTLNHLTKGDKRWKWESE